MITVSRRRINNFHRMIKSDNLLLQSKFQKDLGNLGRAEILLARSKKLAEKCREESIIFNAEDLLKA
jgi:hypothetical protein